MERRRFFYRRKENQTICLLRCFGENSCAAVPERINGLPVTEIGAYCFAENGHLDRQKYEVADITDNTDSFGSVNGLDNPDSPGSVNVPDSQPCVDNENIPDSPDGMSGMDSMSRISGMAAVDSPAGDSAYTLAEQCGRYLTQVILPDTVTRLNAYAFYGCRSLKQITFSLNLRDIENDAFMNCTRLSRLNIRNSISDPGSLRQILAQISWNVETAFYPQLRKAKDGKENCGSEWSGRGNIRGQEMLPEAVLFFAEYLEYYDDLGPAHVFEIQIEGEGYRARQCFLDGLLLMGEYDGTFRKLSSEERVPVACRFALNRLLYPARLLEENRLLFTEFLQAHAAETEQCILEAKDEQPEEMMRNFETVFREHILGKKDLENLLAKVSDLGMAELAAGLIKWKGLYFPEEKKKDRYSFDDFF